MPHYTVQEIMQRDASSKLHVGLDPLSQKRQLLAQYR